MKRLLIFVLPALLTACATAPTKPVCIPVVPYSRETQNQAADELETLERENRAPTLRRFAEDYGELRARNRAACE